MLTSPGSVFRTCRGTPCAMVYITLRRRRRRRQRPIPSSRSKTIRTRTCSLKRRKPPRARLRHRLTGTNGHRTTNITKRGTITEQSNGEKQTIRVGDFKRERRSDRIRGLFRADGVPTGSEDETDDARSHGTKVRIRVKWTERQIEDEKKEDHTEG